MTNTVSIDRYKRYRNKVNDIIRRQKNAAYKYFFVTITSENIKKFTDAQNVLTKMYENEQTEYVTRKIDEIKNAISFKKSALAWKTVNEVSGRKKTDKAKIKANSEKERIQLWHQHFK